MAFVEAGLEIDPENAKLTAVERNIQKRIRGTSASSKLFRPHFAWLPPRASRSMALRAEFFPTRRLDLSICRIVDDRPKVALDSAGYSGRSYCPVLGGFALVARLEQSSQTIRRNWALYGQEMLGCCDIGHCAAICTALFRRNSSYYWIIVFVVTPRVLPQKNKSPSGKATMTYLNYGFNELPSDVADKPYTKGYRITALIYEFGKGRL